MTLLGWSESPLACAYARARGTDRMCSFGDWVALSDECDALTAKLIAREVSDGVIAPGYSAEALEILKTKRKGNYNVVAIDADYVPAPQETKDGLRRYLPAGPEQLQDRCRPAEQYRHRKEGAARQCQRGPDRSPHYSEIYPVQLCLLSLNDGQAIGVGAGQQSRIHCTRLAGSKADTWFLRQHPKVLNLPFRTGIWAVRTGITPSTAISPTTNEDVLRRGHLAELLHGAARAALTAEDKRAYLDAIRGVSLGSDAFFPFARQHRAGLCQSGVSYIAQPGGSIRDDHGHRGRATKTALLWPSPVCGCSTTDHKPSPLGKVAGRSPDG